jgi:hypothetical protein
MHDPVGEITEVEDLRNVVCPFLQNVELLNV